MGKPAWWLLLIAVFAAGILVGAARPYTRNTMEASDIHADMVYRGDLLMTVAIGLNGTAILVDVRLAASEGLREIEFSGDRAAAVGITGLPKAKGVYECIVEEWASEARREFRVRDYWKVTT